MEATKTATSEQVKQSLEKQGKKYLQFQFVNLAGELLGMEESASLIPRFAKDGVGIDGSSVGFTQVNKSDIRLMADWDTFASYTAGASKVDRVLCTLGDLKASHPGCPRSAMKAAVARAGTMGYEPWMFGELEWFFLNMDESPHDHAHYCSLPPEDRAQEIRHEIAEAMETAGLTVKRIHHENGPGQNEVELKLMPALKNADDCVTAASIIRSVAHAHGIKATFLPKPLHGQAGSGFHQHFALYDVKEHKNVFAGEGPAGLSKVGLSFIAGLLRHADEITAVFARHEQTFKRLEPGHEAPSLVCWGAANRTALVRIPDTSDPQDRRVEYRGGDASGNTYLMCAAMLQAGLDGIANNLEAPAPVELNADKLTEKELATMGIRKVPMSMAEADKVLQSSKWLREVLGSHIVDFLVKRAPAKH